MIYCFWLVIATGAFWVVNMWHAVELFDGIFQTGRWPVGIYPGWLRYSVTFLVPIAFAVTVPAQAVTSRLEWPTLLPAPPSRSCSSPSRAGSGASASGATRRFRVGRAPPRRPAHLAALPGRRGVRVLLGWTVAVVFFVTELGMSPLELVLTGTALEVAYFLFEVPTGIVADTYSRRASVVIGALILGLGFGRPARLRGPRRVDRRSGDGLRVDVQERRRGRVAGGRAGHGERRQPLPARGAGRARGRCSGSGPRSVSPSSTSGSRSCRRGRARRLGASLALVMPETGFRPAGASRSAPCGRWRRPASRGGRLIRARPMLLLIVGIAFFGGMWSEAFDRLWEGALPRRHRRARPRRPRPGGLVRDPERRAAPRDLRRAAAPPPFRAPEPDRHDAHAPRLRRAHDRRHARVRLRRRVRGRGLAYWSTRVLRRSWARSTRRGSTRPSTTRACVRR